MRTTIQCLTRLTNAFAKKVGNHRVTVTLRFAHHNAVRLHQTIECGPVMAAGMSRHPWSFDWLLDRSAA